MSKPRGPAPRPVGWEQRQERFVAFRALLGLSQSAVGERAGWRDISSVSRIESGEHRLAYVTARQRAAAGYGLSVADFERLCDGRLTADEAAKLAGSAAA